MPNIKFFLWLVIRNVIPICEFLIARRTEISNIYCLCNQNMENMDHIFKNCPFVEGIWDRIKFDCPTPFFFLRWFFYFLFYHGLIQFIKTIKLIAKFSTIQWKKLLLFCRMFGYIEIKWCLRKSNPTPFKVLQEYVIGP